MYRPPPENINRVKTIKSKFENIQNNADKTPEKKIQMSKSPEKKLENKSPQKKIELPTFRSASGKKVEISSYNRSTQKTFENNTSRTAERRVASSPVRSVQSKTESRLYKLPEGKVRCSPPISPEKKNENIPTSPDKKVVSISYNGSPEKRNQNAIRSLENQNYRSASASPEKKDIRERSRYNLTSALNKTPESLIDPKPFLTRQLSDPSKCNIKRRPAFRVDTSCEKAITFQRDSIQNRSHRLENKIKQYNSVVKNNNDTKNHKNICENDIPNKTDENIKLEKDCLQKNENLNWHGTKPPLIKSKSSIDFAYLRSKFDSGNIMPKENTSQRSDDSENTQNQRSTNNPDMTKPFDISLLYTEPIPKALRVKNCDTKASNIVENDLTECLEAQIISDDNTHDLDEKIHNCSTLKLSDPVKPDCDISYDIVKKNKGIALTDTLQKALSKPLPDGPAPRKPPRTFLHSPQSSPTEDLPKNSSFLYSPKDTEKKLNLIPKLPNGRAKGKGDAKYMLNKLENALKNNKIRSKKQLKAEISTSGEDSDDSVLFKSKTKRQLPKVPSGDLVKTNSLDNLFVNCFNGLACSRSPYAKIDEPNSSFFVDGKKEEHVYAEPFHAKKDTAENGDCMRRNNLYYLSSPVQGCRETVLDRVMDSPNKENNEEKDSKCTKENVTDPKVLLSEDSSLSSFTSDFDSATSTPHEETKPFDLQATKIKSLIKNFESKPPSRSAKPVNFDSTTRIEELKNCLRNTLDKTFTTHDVNFKDSNSESEKSYCLDPKKANVDEMVNKFETYVKMIRSFSKTKIKKDNNLFDCCFIVEWVCKTAQIKFKFPYNAKIPPRIEDLCYPEASTGPLDKTNNAQNYTLVITNDKGERTFGYCRRVIPEGSKDCLPLTYCILSKIRAPRFYKKILAELESRHGLPNRQRDELISEFYYNKVPKPGESIKINLTKIAGGLDSINGKKKHYDTTYNKGDCSQNESLCESLDLTSYVIVNKNGEYGSLNKVVKKHCKEYENIYVNVNDYRTSCSTPSLIAERKDGGTELIITLHSDTRYEDADLKPLHKLSTDILLKIFASLLLERKVILVSCVISKLSCCVEALQSILYPFSWPHTFIPILPQSLWDIVESPTPVLCGVLSVAVVNEFKIEHGIVVDLDEGNILIEEGDEDKILCSSMVKAWHKGIMLANSISPKEYVYSVYLGDAYQMAFIQCFRDYKNFIVNGKFQKDSFLRSKTKGKRRFLKWFTETTMFMSFLDAVLTDPKSFAIFDKKIEMYGSEESDIIVDKLLEWKR